MYVDLGWLPHKGVWLWWHITIWVEISTWSGKFYVLMLGFFTKEEELPCIICKEKMLYDVLWCLMVLQGWRGYLGITVRKTRIKRYQSQHDTSRKLWWKHRLCVIRDQEYRRMSASKYPVLPVESNMSSEIWPLSKKFWRSIEWF